MNTGLREFRAVWCSWIPGRRYAAPGMTAEVIKRIPV